MDRRAFLVSLGLATALPAAARAFAANTGIRWDRTLVLLHLYGGNDGLSTLVPYADPLYARLRPGLAVARDSVLPLDERLGLHPALAPLMPAWQSGELALIRGLGYQPPNRSHFRSSEIWDAATTDIEPGPGWIARLFKRAPPPEDTRVEAVALGYSRHRAFLGEGLRAVAIPAVTRRLAVAPDDATLAIETDNPALAHVLKIKRDTARWARLLSPVDYTGPGERYPEGDLGLGFATVLRLIRSGTGVPVIALAHNGYDTHKDQARRHRRLLAELAAALSWFRAQSIADGSWERTLVMTYSEFGRRVVANDSGGTDHGTAAPQLMLGGRVRGGLYGTQPGLSDLEDSVAGFAAGWR